MFYVASRDWATKNPDKVKAFRASLREADAFIKANPVKAREDVNKYFKLPPDAVKTIALPTTAPDLTGAQVSFWADVMKRLGLVDKAIDPAKVMVP